MQGARRQLAVMIIGMALVLPFAPPAGAGTASSLPTPLGFVTSLEVGDVQQAQAWLDAGLPVNFMGSRIGSGLMIGAWEGNMALMTLFLSRGADINAINGNGESALALAAWHGRLDIVKWLVAQGARVNAPPRHWSALHYAAFSGHGEVVDYLLAQGADINALSTNGSSATMLAIYEGREAVARKLIEKGADRSIRNDWGDGALEWAMRFNHLGIARMLTNPEEFNLAVNQPKESWGEPKRSARTSKELDKLLTARQILLEQGLPTDALDKRIAAERVRLLRAEMDRPAPARAATLEIAASRKAPGEQSVQVIYDERGKAVGFKAPPATYFGTPRMPPKVPIRNY